MSAETKLRVVYDCNVLLVAAAKEKSAAAACLWLARSGYVRLFLSQDVLEELTEVLNRPKIRASFVTLTDELVSSFLDQLREVGEFVRSVPFRRNSLIHAIKMMSSTLISLALLMLISWSAVTKTFSASIPATPMNANSFVNSSAL